MVGSAARWQAEDMTKTTDPPPAGFSEERFSQRLSLAARGLRRSSQHRKVAGVCAGLARTLGIDPLLVRIVTVLLVIFGGGGILFYAAAWLLLPVDTGQQSLARRVLSGPGRSVGEVLLSIGLALLAIAGLSDILFRDGRFDTVLLLAVLIGAWLLFDRQPVPGGSYPHPGLAASAESLTDPTGADTHASGVQDNDGTTVGNTPGVDSTLTAPLPRDLAPWAAAPTPPVPPRPRTPRSPLPRLTLSLVLLALGVLGLLEYLDAVNPPAGSYPALALVILSIGLLVGTWWGRARSLIPWVVLLIPLLALATAVNSSSGPAVDRRVVISNFGQLPRADNYSAGTVVYDLSALPELTQSTELSIALNLGEIVVIVPKNMDVISTINLNTGSTTRFGRSEEGRHITSELIDFGADGDNGQALRLSTSAKLGSVEVRRATS